MTEFFFLGYTIIALILSIVDFHFAVKAFRKTGKVGRAIAWSAAFACVITLAYLGSVHTANPALVSLCSNLTFISIDCMLVSLAYYAFLVTGLNSIRGSRAVNNIIRTFASMDILMLLVNIFTGVATTFERLDPVGIAYRMKSHKIDMNKQLVVDYRERTTTTRTHNPQSHVFFMLDKNDPVKDHIEEIKFGQDFTQETLKIRLDYAFDKDDNDLSTVEVCVWPKNGGVDETIEDGFACPDSVVPLKRFTLDKNSTSAVEINWAPDKAEDIGYYYQLLFTYAPGVPNRYSPEKVWTKPFFSTNEDLIIQPDTYVFYRKYPIRVSTQAFDVISGVDLNVTVNPDSENPFRKLISLDKEHASNRLIVRGCDKEEVPVKLEKTFRLADLGSPIQPEPEFQSDDEIVINNPIAEKSFTFNLSGVGGGVSHLLFVPTVTSPQYGVEVENESIELDATAPTQKKKIRILTASDVISYKVQAYASNKWSDLCTGEFSAGTKEAVLIDLSMIGKKKYTLKWTGRSPEENGLQYVSVILKDGDGEVVQTVNFKGAAVPEPIEFAVDAGKELILSVERKPVGGLPEPAQVSMVTSDVIEIKP